MIGLALCLLAAPMAAPDVSLATASSASTASAVLLGTWDVGPFDNDAAADWYARFAEAPSWQEIHRAFATTARPDYLEADDASIAVAAAAVVSAAQLGQFDTLPLDGRSATAGLGKPSAALLREAEAALARIQNDSELAELWAEGDASPWLASLDLIQSGLK